MTGSGDTDGYGRKAEVVISSPEELIASVPSMLGFTPGAGSVVLVCGRTRGGGQGPVVRLDAHGLLGIAPDDPFAGPTLDPGSESGYVDAGPAQGMADYCSREEVESLHLVVVHEQCTEDAAAEQQAVDAADAFVYWLGLAGTSVLGAWGVGEFAAGSRWVDLRGISGGLQADPDCTEIAAVYAFDGRVRQDTREDIDWLYRFRDEQAVDHDAEPIDPGGRSWPARLPVPLRTESGVRLHDDVARRMDTGAATDDAELADVGAVLLDVAIRDAVLARVARDRGRRDDDEGYQRLWWALARRRPPRERSVALALLGAAAYLSGSGVHARAAFTEALVSDRGNSLARVLLDALDRGLAPEKIRQAAAA